jgi:hypothetical protein
VPEAAPPAGGAASGVGVVAGWQAASAKRLAAMAIENFMDLFLTK